MNNINYWTTTLAYLVWPELFVPVRVQENGDFQFILEHGQIVQFNRQSICIAFLRGIHTAEAK